MVKRLDWPVGSPKCALSWWLTVTRPFLPWGVLLGGAILSSTTDCQGAWHHCKWHQTLWGGLSLLPWSSPVTFSVATLFLDKLLEAGKDFLPGSTRVVPNAKDKEVCGPCSLVGTHGPPRHCHFISSGCPWPSLSKQEENKLPCL